MNMNVTAKSTKTEVITSALEAIDYHQDQHFELLRQRNALLIVVTILATMVFW